MQRDELQEKVGKEILRKSFEDLIGGAAFPRFSFARIYSRPHVICYMASNYLNDLLNIHN